MVVALDVFPEFFPCLFGIELRIGLDFLDQLVVAVHGRVASKHVQDEPLIYGLFHRVAMERSVFHLALGIGRQGLAEHLQRLALGRGREGKIAGIGQHLACRHAFFQGLVHRVFGVGIPFPGVLRPQRLVHRRRGPPALAGVRLVDDDGEGLARLARDFVEDERELLHRGDDDLLAFFDEFPEIAGVFRVAHRGAHLHELLDGPLDLVVENAPIRHYDHRVENGLADALGADELVRQPRNGVRLAAARRVLHKIATADTMAAHVLQRLAHHIELVEAREYLAPPLLARLGCLFFDNLGIVFEDVGQPRPGEHFLPQVIRLQPPRVGRIARPVVPALVERQEPRALALQFGAHPHLAIVHGEVDRTAPEFKQLLPGVPVAAVLLHRILHRLLRQAVLQLEGGNGQSVDEQAQVQRPARLVEAVAHLARDAEPIQGVQRRRLGVALRWRAVKQVEVPGGMVLHPLAQHVHHAPAADFRRQPGQELLPNDVAGVHVIQNAEFPEGGRLGDLQELEQLGHVQRIGAVVVLRISRQPSGALRQRDLRHDAFGRRFQSRRTGQVPEDQRFKALFANISRHGGRFLPATDHRQSNNHQAISPPAMPCTP